MKHERESHTHPRNIIRTAPDQSHSKSGGLQPNRWCQRWRLSLYQGCRLRKIPPQTAGYQRVLPDGMRRRWVLWYADDTNVFVRWRFILVNLKWNTYILGYMCTFNFKQFRCSSVSVQFYELNQQDRWRILESGKSRTGTKATDGLDSSKELFRLSSSPVDGKGTKILKSCDAVVDIWYLYGCPSGAVPILWKHLTLHPDTKGLFSTYWHA